MDNGQQTATGFKNGQIIFSPGSSKQCILNNHDSQDSISIGRNAGGNLGKRNEGTQGNFSIAIGANAGKDNQGNFAIAIGGGEECTGALNQEEGAVAIGKCAGNNNQGTNCIGLGVYSGHMNQKDESIALGNHSGYMDQSEKAISIGYDSGFQTQGQDAISIGTTSGKIQQLHNSIAIGLEAGESYQNFQSIAIGTKAGNLQQSYNSIAIGSNAGQTDQQNGAIAIGNMAGHVNQGVESIAIGKYAGITQIDNNSIIINASGEQINTSEENQFIVKPISINQNIDDEPNILFYDNDTGEISQGPLPIEDKELPEGENFGEYLYHSGDGWVLGTTKINLGTGAGANDQSTDGIAIGNQAANDSQSQYSVAIGYQAGMTNQGTNSVDDEDSDDDDPVRDPTQGRAIAIGYQAGFTGQHQNAIAIGDDAGKTNQNEDAIGIGTYAGNSNQGQDSISIGRYAGVDTQGTRSIAIGDLAGNTKQGDYCIAIGYRAGTGIKADDSGPEQANQQPDQTIIINATDEPLNIPFGTNSSQDQKKFFVKPIAPKNEIDENTNSDHKVLVYNNNSGEISYANDPTLHYFNPLSDTNDSDITEDITLTYSYIALGGPQENGDSINYFLFPYNKDHNDTTNIPNTTNNEFYGNLPIITSTGNMGRAKVIEFYRVDATIRDIDVYIDYKRGNGFTDTNLYEIKDDNGTYLDPPAGFRLKKANGASGVKIIWNPVNKTWNILNYSSISVDIFYIKTIPNLSADPE